VGRVPPPIGERQQFFTDIQHQHIPVAKWPDSQIEAFPALSRSRVATTTIGVSGA
jgi:hypothetical protein